MTLDELRPLANRGLKPFVRLADRVGFTPNSISIFAFCFAVLAAFSYVYAGAAIVSPREPIFYASGAVLVFFSGWFDLLDGALARWQGVASKSGDLLDHVLDRYADIVIIGGIAGGTGQLFLGFFAITGVLMTSYLGTQAQAVGLERVYGGLVGRADRLAIIGIVTAITPIFPNVYAGLTLVGWLLVFLGIVGHFTALQRFYYATKEL